MKIAFVTDTYFPRINGVSTSTRTFANEYVKLGHEVEVFAPAYHETSADGFPVHRFPSAPVFFDPEDRLGLPLRDRRLVRHFLAADFDIVHTQTPFTLGGPAVGWARRSGARIVHTYHTLFAAYIAHYLPWFPRGLARRYTRWFSRRYCNRCDLLICPSGGMRQELAGYGTTTPIEVIPTGIDLTRLENPDGARFRRLLGLPATARVLLFMGRVAEEKNLDFLLRIAARLRRELPDLKLLFAGEGAAKPRLKQRVGQMGLTDTVMFLGYLDGADWRDCYAAADVFVFSSVTETQGLVVTEAMAVGTPVVAVGELGIRDVMASGRGGIMTRLDEAEFALAVRRVLLEPGLRRRLQAEARDEAARWSSGAMARRMLRAYEGLLGAAPAASAVPVLSA